MKILIADDYDLMREWLEVLVTDIACEVKKAETFDEALVIAEAFQPDVVLLDLKFKYQDVAVTINRVPELRKILPSAAIIAVSGVADEEALRRVMEAGASAVVRKENRVTENVLLNAMRDALDKIGSGELLEQVNKLIEKRILETPPSVALTEITSTTSEQST